MSNKFYQTPLAVWRLCQECAAEIYDTYPYSAWTQDKIARLLFGTAAQESRLIYRRQISSKTNKPMEGYGGAFSLWQVERGSVRLTLQSLRKRPNIARRAHNFCFSEDDPFICEMPAEAILERSMTNDRLGCLLGRMHYLRVRCQIPDSLEEQAYYWKRWYNTFKGKGTPEQYMKNWRAICEPVVKESANV